MHQQHIRIQEGQMACCQQNETQLYSTSSTAYTSMHYVPIAARTRSAPRAAVSHQGRSSVQVVLQRCENSLLVPTGFGMTITRSNSLSHRMNTVKLS